MSEQQNNPKCARCNSELSGSYCSNCGHPKELKRINGKYILSEIGSVLNFNKGIFFTIKELLIRPGVNIRKFIHEDRHRLVKPVVFLIVCSLVYTILQKVVHFEDGYVNYSFDESSAVTSIFTWVSQNYGYANVLIAIFIALWIKIFFRKYNYNFFEILILLCFLMGMGMLLFSFFGVIDSMSNAKIIDKGFMVAILYIAWGIARFFDKKKVINYLKAFISYILGMFTFSFVTILLGFLIDWMLNF